MPQLGSSPLGKAQYYSATQYKQLLQYANERHVVIIPEFDTPGHAHAAINAMLARYNK